MTLALTALLVGAASLLFLSDSWRLSISALAALYLVLAIIVGVDTFAAFGAVRLLADLTTVGILVSALKAFGPVRAGGMQYAFGLPYRLATGVFALAVAFSLADTHPFGDVPPDLGFAVYWLCALGLITLVLARRALATGYSLLMIEAAGQLLLTNFNQGPGLTRLLLASLAQIGISLAVAYLLVMELETEPAG